MSSLQERLGEFKKSFESGAPPYNAPREAIETMHRATAELKAAGMVGGLIPLFSSVAESQGVAGATATSA